MAGFPRFFKVFLSALSSESMVIPRSFHDELDDPLPETAILQGTGGRDWTVSWKKVGRSVFFTDGWSKFAEDHELQDGEFMTFVYDGHRNFEVSVYDLEGVKVIRAPADIVVVSDSDDDDDEDEEDDDDSSNLQEDEEISQSVYSLNTEETVPVPDSDFINGNPCFDTTLKNRIYELLIPANVVHTNRLRFGGSIKYIDKEGAFEGSKGKWTDDRICFKGWDRVRRRNRIKEEDTIRCELIHTNKLVHSIKVHVIRGAA